MTEPRSPGLRLGNTIPSLPQCLAVDCFLRSNWILRLRSYLMPTTIKCPTCKRALEVPDELMGKRVKCPGCKMIFTAMPPGATPADTPSTRRPPPEEGIRRKRSAAPPDEDEEDEEGEEERPRLRKKPT